MRRSHKALAIGAGAAAILAFASGLWLGHAVPEPARLSGERATRSFDLSGFERLRVTGQWQTEIVRSDAWQVELSYPVELEEALIVEVDDGELVLRHARTGSWSDFGSNENLRLTARVGMPELRGVASSGASLVTFAGFDGAELDVRTSGAGRIEGRDSVYDELDLDLSGAGAADLSGVTVEDARVEVSGAYAVTLRMAGGTLSGDVSGASSIEYYGEVRTQRVDTSGVARVRDLD